MTKQEPVRILQYGLDKTYGGTEAYVINLYRHLDREKIQFDFLIKEGTYIPFEDEIKMMGGKIYREARSLKKNPLKAHEALDFFFKNHPEIEGIEMNSNSMVNFLPLFYAKKNGVPLRIYHAHNSGNMDNNDNLVFNLWKKFSLKKVGNNATHLFACSEDAGKFMFNHYPFDVINNAIDISLFSFDNNVRELKRKELSIQDDYVVGFVGRIQYQKNPEYLIDVFKEISKRKVNTKLMIVGSGDLEDEIRLRIKKYGLEKNILMLGPRDDVNELYQAMDAFLLPSRFEGFGIVLAEAQCAGLQCFTSINVPKSTKLTNNIYYMDTSKDPEVWAEQILNKSKNYKRTYQDYRIRDNGFDIKLEAKKLENFYKKNTQR